MKKIYFYDLGIRNTLLSAFQSLDLRTDVGALWENFVILEMRKHITYSQKSLRQYFWRTKLQEEIDLVQMVDGIISAYECKWSPQSYRPPKAFTNAYPDTPVTLVTQEDYFRFFR